MADLPLQVIKLWDLRPQQYTAPPATFPWQYRISYPVKHIYLLLIACFLTGTLHAQTTDPLTGERLYNGPGESDFEKAYSVVENAPTVVGGAEAIKHYFDINTRYPSDETVEGTVFVELVVTKTGEVKDVKVIKGLSPALDKEAVRLIEGIGPWHPGKHYGRLVHSRIMFPVRFSKK